MSLGARILTAMVAAVVVAATGAMVAFERHAEATAARIEASLVERQASRARLELSGVADRAAEDLDVLLRFAPLAAVLESGDGEARSETERLFEALMDSHLGFLQLRLLDASGMERVRFERTMFGEAVRQRPDVELQSKARRSYFREAMQLGRGAIYYSPIELNREHGLIGRHRHPVWRLASPVVSDSGRRLGIVVLNLDLRPVLELYQRHATYLVNADGDYLAHPEPERAFAFEFDPDARDLADEHPELARMLRARSTSERGIEVAEFESEGIDMLFGLARLAPQHGPTLWIIACTESVRTPLLWGARRTGILTAVVVGLLATLWAFVLSRSISRPLFQLRDAVETFPTISLGSLPRSSIPEIAALIRSFAEASRMVLESRRLAEREAEFRAIVEASPVALLLVDQDLRIRLSNTAAARLLGFESEELQGMSIDQFVPVGARSGHARWASNYFERPVRHAMGANRVLSLIPRSGEPTPIEIGLSPISFDGDQMVLASIVDLSEQVRARKWVENLIAVLPTAKLLLSADGRISTANRAAEAMFGYTADALCGRSLGPLLDAPILRTSDPFADPAFVSGDPGLVFRRIDRLISEAKGELKARRRDGSLVPIEMRIATVEGPHQHYIIVSALDISEQQEIKAKLRRSNMDLARFASAASHDLKEPLRNIAGFAKLLSDRYGGDLDARASRYVQHIVDNSERMLALISDVLSFSRIGAEEEPFASVDSRQVLKTVEAALQTRISETGARLEVGPMPIVTGDAAQLGRVFQNLISNAIKFRGKKDPVVRVGAKETEDGWHFSVQDNGIGIDESDHSKVFDMFQRLHSHTEYSGTGIGLAAAERIVRRHGGRIWVESEIGAGATFHFTIPKRGLNP